MWWIILGIIAWLACGVTGYLLLRAGERNNGHVWTQRDRRLALLLSTIIAPGFLVFGAFWFLYSDGERPAKW